MKKGFTLIEVLISLCILMICILAFTKMNLACIHAKAYGERLTRATVLGNTKLCALRAQSLTLSDFHEGWHQDQNNPLKVGETTFYRFWTALDRIYGKDVIIFVAWDDKTRAKVRDFSSLEELKSSSCPCISLEEVFLNQR